MRLRMRTRWLHVVLILPVGGTAINSPSVVIFRKDAYLEDLETRILGDIRYKLRTRHQDF
jgi:hypothetical protein